MSVVEAADTVTLERGYGEFAKEAKALAPDYQARSICHRRLGSDTSGVAGALPKITLVLCFPTRS